MPSPGRPRTHLDLLTRLVDKSMVTVPGDGGSRYVVLETLRAGGRSRREAAGLDRLDAVGTPATSPSWPSGRPGSCRDRTSWRGWSDGCPTTTICGPPSSTRRPAPPTSRCGWSVFRELGYLRVGYESAEWAERALDRPSPSTRCSPRRSGPRRAGPGTGATSGGPASWPPGRRCPRRGTGRIAYPDDVVADVLLYQNDAESALRPLPRGAPARAADGDPIRLVWTLYYLAVCRAVRRAAGRCRRPGVRGGGRGTANPTARSMARYALGLVLKKTEPDRALELFDEAIGARDGGTQPLVVRNRADGGRSHPRRAPRPGPPAGGVPRRDRPLGPGRRLHQQWLNLRYILRLLARLGADEDALHGFLVAAGKPSPLDRPGSTPARPGGGSGAGEAAAVAHARAALTRMG